MKAVSGLLRPDGLPLKMLWGGLAAAVSGGGRFLALLLLARELGAEGFGQLAWLLWGTELAIAFVTAGWSQAVTRYGAERFSAGQAGEAVTMARVLVRWALAGALVFLPLFAGWLAWTLGWGAHLTWVALGLYLLGVVAAFAPAWLQGRQAFASHAGLSLAATLLLLLATVVGAKVAGVPGALAGFAVATIPAAWVVFSIGVWSASRIPPGERRRVFRFVAATWGAASLSAVVWMRTEVLFLERFVSREEVGIYASALVFATMLTQVVLLFRGVLLPHFSTMATEGRREELIGAYRRSTLLFAAVLFPVCALGAGLSPGVAAIFGLDFQAAWPLFAVLAAGGAVQVFAAGGALATSLERNRFVFVAAGVGAASFVALCLLLIPWLGIWGAVAARLLGQWGMGIAGVIYLQRVVSVGLPAGRLFYLAGASVAAGAVCFLFARDATLGGALAGFLAGGITFGALISSERVLKIIRAKE